MSARAITFQEAVCAKFGCAPEAYAESVFRHTLYAHGRWLALRLAKAWPKLFADDFDLIEAVGKCDSRGAIRRELEAHRHHYPPDGLLCRDLHLRLSGQKLLALADDLLPSHPERTGWVRPAPEDLPSH